MKKRASEDTRFTREHVLLRYFEDASKRRFFSSSLKEA